MIGRRHQVLVLGVAIIAACSIAEPINPLPTSAGQGGGNAAGAGGAGQGGHGGGVIKRTVFLRNPFGNVAETQNLLWDGDLEFYDPLSDEYGWLSGPPATYTFTGVRIGAVCHSGLKCGAVADQHFVAAIGVGLAASALEASFWVHLDKGACSGVEASVTSLFDPQPPDPDAPITPLAATPDTDGWCHFDSVVPARTSKASLFIENKTGGEVLVDDAVLKASPAITPPSPHAPPTPQHAAAIAEARHALAKLRGPHDKPPSPARRAYEAWRKR